MSRNYYHDCKTFGNDQQQFSSIYNTCSRSHVNFAIDIQLVDHRRVSKIIPIIELKKRNFFFVIRLGYERQAREQYARKCRGGCGRSGRTTL